MDWKNWWDYHKWYVIGGILLAVFLVRRVGYAVGFFGIKSDLQVAYVGENPLPEETQEAVKGALKSLIWDFNGDGRLEVEFHSYAEGLGEEGGDEGLTYSYGKEIVLLGDIQDCDSYLFLLEDPENFQVRYQLLACEDGSEPAPTDFSVEGKGFLWEECPALASLDLGYYEESVLGMDIEGENQEKLGGLFVGRRCFPTKKTCKNLENCQELWERLSESVEGAAQVEGQEEVEEQEDIKEQEVTEGEKEG